MPPGKVSFSLKQVDIQAFHNHMNTSNKNIQFTIEIPEVRNGEQSIAFLHTRSLQIQLVWLR